MERKVVVITGASAGVGRATAQSFARRGWKVGLIARDVDRLEATRREVEELGGQALALPCDVADAGQIETAAALAETELGPIDVWVNNAMTTVFARFDTITPAEYRRATEVTYLGYVWGTMVALRRMKPRNRGSIVQVGSTLSYRAIPLQSAYCGAKFAIRGFTDSLRCELLHDKVNVHLSMVQLPAINTPQFDWSLNKMSRSARPMAPIFQPEVAGEAVYYASQHHRREICVGANTVLFTIANKIWPGLGDTYLALTGYEAQQGSEPVAPDRPHNLFEPVPGDYAARGRFDAESSLCSPQFEFNKSHVGIGALAMAGLLGIIAGLSETRRKNGNGNGHAHRTNGASHAGHTKAGKAVS